MSAADLAPRRPALPAAARGAAALLGLAALGGCRNPCQDLCHEMADYAAEDCGEEWSQDEIKACTEAYREADDDEQAVCEDIAPSLREEWTCDDLSPYFSGGGASGGTDGTDGTDGTGGTADGG